MTISQPPRLDAATLFGIINSASDLMTAAYGAYATGTLGPEMVEAVEDVQGDMGRFLAFFEDGKGFGWAQPATLESMRNIEQMASDLLVNLDAIAQVS